MLHQFMAIVSAILTRGYSQGPHRSRKQKPSMAATGVLGLRFGNKVGTGNLRVDLSASGFRNLVCGEPYKTTVDIWDTRSVL